MSAETRYFEQPIRHRQASCMDSSALEIAVQGRLGEGPFLAELTLVGMPILRAEVTVAERSAARRSPVMQPVSQSSASLSFAYARPR